MSQMINWNVILNTADRALVVPTLGGWSNSTQDPEYPAQVGVDKKEGNEVVEGDGEKGTTGF